MCDNNNEKDMPKILYVEEGKTKSIKEALNNDLKDFIKNKRK